MQHHVLMEQPKNMTMGQYTAIGNLGQHLGHYWSFVFWAKAKSKFWALFLQLSPYYLLGDNM